MATVNKQLEALSLEDIHRVSEQFLMGWHDFRYIGYNFRVKGLNAYRKKHGLPPLDKEWSLDYRINYIRTHFSADEIENQIRDYCQQHRLNDERWNGIEILDCRFGREYAKAFKMLLGASKWKRISEQARVEKLVDTQTQLYGGVGVAGKEAYRKMSETKTNNYRQTRTFESIGEEVVYNLLVERFGEDDVVYQYGVHPYDERYPFPCDFYIKSKDLFIEMNIHFSHGNHWFDKSDHDDMLKVKHWTNEGRKYMKQVKQWTVSDPLKRETAKKSKLNYLVFWDGRHRRNKDKHYDYTYMPVLEDFKRWYYEYDCDTDAFLKDNPANTY